MPAALAEQIVCFCIRIFFFFCVWTVVSGLSVATSALGAVTAIGASWVSVSLLPCWPSRMNPVAWLRLLARIPGQALISGVGVARRALDPTLRLRPGFTPYKTALPKGVAQNAFAALAALQPGSAPIRKETPGNFDIHCLDTDAPIVATLEREEARLRDALGLELRDE